MAKISVLDYDIATAANNSDIGSIAILGTSLISNFDNAFRELMLEIGVAITRHATKAAGTYVPAKTDHNQLWRATGAVTLNLTAAATLTTGWALWLKADGGAILVDPNSTETINGATTLTIPDGSSAFVVCTGTAFFAIVFDDSTNIKTAVLPSVDDGAALGSTTKEWSDLFLASGGVINWANSNVTLTHASGKLTSTGTVSLPDGTTALPALASSTNPDLGIYWAGGTAVSFTVDSVNIGRFGTDGLHLGKTAGSLATAGLSFFATSTSNGLFQITRDANIAGQFNRLTSDGTIVEWMTTGTARGSVSIAGSTTSYNTSSDKRLKENLREFDAGSILDKLSIWEFDWKEDGSVGHGVMAQDAVKVYPEAIKRPENRKQKWQADYSKFVPLLLQEVKNLRKEVSALKGKA
jgi:hypothetical protein